MLRQRLTDNLLVWHSDLSESSKMAYNAQFKETVSRENYLSSITVINSGPP